MGFVSRPNVNYSYYLIKLVFHRYSNAQYLPVIINGKNCEGSHVS